MVLCGISTCFQVLSPCLRQVPHALLTRSPLDLRDSCRSFPPSDPVRLACVKHAASVRPEPGSNSFVQSFPLSFPTRRLLFYLILCPLLGSIFQCSPFTKLLESSGFFSFVFFTLYTVFKVLPVRGAQLPRRLDYNTTPLLLCQLLFCQIFYFFFCPLFQACRPHSSRSRE